MTRQLGPIVAAFVAVAALAETADAANIVYVHGRSWGNWSTEVVSVGTTGHVNRTQTFNGNARIHDSGVDSFVRGVLTSNCAGGQSCIVIAYSAGALRTFKAIDDIYAGGGSLPGLLWVEVLGGASGGTGLAELSTTGFTKIIAKLLGQQEAVDKDLTVSAARTTYGYVQDAMVATPAYAYHIGGTKNTCKKILFVKICGNSYVGFGIGDGVVPMHSATGASTAAAVSNGCTVAKYPDRVWESRSPCAGENRDHFGVAGRGVWVTEQDVASTAITGDKNKAWIDPAATAAIAECSGANCDNAFEAGDVADYSKSVNATTGAYESVGVTDVSSQASATTGNTASTSVCMGQCGVYVSGRPCQCDSACTTYGDCCGDYTTANCAAVNQ